MDGIESFQSIAEKALERNSADRRVKEDIALKQYFEQTSPAVDNISNTFDLKQLFWLPCVSESFLILVQRLKCSTSSDEMNKVFDLFSWLLVEDTTMCTLISELCGCCDSSELSRSILICGDQILQFPDLVASLTQGDSRHHQFTSENFFTTISSSTVRFLQKTSNNWNSENTRTDFTLLSTLIAKCCKRELCSGPILRPLIHYGATIRDSDYISRSLFWKLFSSCPKQYLDSVIISLLKLCPSWKMVSIFLGDLVVQCSIAQSVFMEKFTNVKYFDDNQFICNLIGYFVGPETSRLSLFGPFCSSLLDLWKDHYVISYAPYEQLLYINKCTTLAVLNHPSIGDIGQSWNGAVMQGITNYLKSSIDKTRTLGVCCGQLICNAINNSPQSNSKSKLSFPQEVVSNEVKLQIDSLLQSFREQSNNEFSFTRADVSPDKDNLRIKGSQTAASQQETSESVFEASNNSNKGDPLIINDGLDSDDDDDFKPYDMSNDVKIIKFTKSFYLHDLLSNLSNEKSSTTQSDSTKADLFEQTLIDAEQIINSSDENTLRELCLDVAKILIYIEDKYATQNFEVHRVNALTSLLVREPKMMASFLIGQFYETNFSIRHRIDILQTIRNGAERLSSVSRPKDETFIETNKSKDLSASVNVQLSWREKIDARVLAKTKFYHKSKPRPIAAVENKFSSVCGCFFFPFLQHYDKPIQTLHLFKEDSQIFSNLIYTLAIVIHYSVHSNQLPKMVQTLLAEFCKSYIDHEDSAVRQSVWFSVLVSILALPKDVLLGDDELIKCFMFYRLKADQCQSDDPHSECRLLSLQFLQSFNSILVS